MQKFFLVVPFFLTHFALIAQSDSLESVINDNDDRIIYINRLKLWRYILGNPEIDVDYWLTRIKI